jgi:bacillithiol system protein YtxJ
MNWNELNLTEQLDEINENSKSTKVLIFKHSTRCIISKSALDRLERNWIDEKDSFTLKPYLLDLLNHRDISNTIAQKWQIEHESPQVLIIENEKCIYNTSHNGIDYEEIMSLS